MQEQTVLLSTEWIALCDLIKVAGVAASGGAGKALVASGAVRVDGVPEQRKTRKIRAGQTVELAGVRIRVATPAPQS
jgi:ribosome-associated protein